VIKQFQQLKNGEKLAYLQYGKGKTNLILIHGNYSSSYQFLKLINKFDEDVYTVYAVDLRCFGDSTCYRKVTSIDDYVDDIRRFIEAKEIKDPHLIGFSLGGGVALQLCGHHPEKCKTLTLISSITYRGYPLYKKDDNGNVLTYDTYRSAIELREDPDVKPILTAIEKKDVNSVMSFMDTYFFGDHRPDDDNYYLALINEVMKERGLCEAIFAMATFNMSSEHNFYIAGNHTINYIDIPVLHLVGINDLLTPRHMVLENYYALHKNSKLIEYNDFGHSLLYLLPREIAKHVTMFIGNQI
jgi:pimeloyl-ACP methyl ester carboxylesterase